jgi:hypothetical protein
MRLTSIICLTLSILGCSEKGTQRPPTVPTPPVATPPPPSPGPPPSSNLVVLWGYVVDPSGVCIEGATVEVVGGPMLLGQHAAQTTPCDSASLTGGFWFDEGVLPAIRMILRASAPGYLSL